MAHDVVSAGNESLNFLHSSVLRHHIWQDPAVLDENLSLLEYLVYVAGAVVVNLVVCHDVYLLLINESPAVVFH